MRRRIWLSGAALTSLALLIVQGAAAEQTFTDPPGDSGPGPDITSVLVSDDAAGTITFKVTTANRPALTEDYSLGLHLDTDSNAATGREGSDFLVLVLSVGGSPNALLGEYAGGTLNVKVSSSATASYANGVATISISKADLRNTAAFRFWIGVDDNPDDDSNWDAGPDAGWWPYTLATQPPPPPAPLKLAAGKPAAMPGPAKAGGAFTVAMTVTRSDGKPFTGAVACTAKAGAATLRAAGRAMAGSARCTMRLPKTAKGKRLTGSITATAGTAKVAKTYGFAIR